MKKAILLLLSFVLLFTLFAGNAFADGTELIMDPCEAEPGDEISVPLRLVGNPGIISVELDIVYDPEVMEWVGVQAGDFGGTIGDYEIGIGQSVAWFARDERTDITQDGLLVTLRFKIKEDTDAKTTQISVNYAEDNIFNAAYENVYCSITPGVVTIKGTSVQNYTVSYDANGGTGAPALQPKTPGTNLTLSNTEPTRADTSAGSYTVTLNANGGSVSPTSLSAARTTSYTFKNWNTAADGSGTNYNAGATYRTDADVTLYAQWNSSTKTAAVTLPTPTRNGYTFKGWGTSSSAASGVTGSYTPTKNVTLYAVWETVPTPGTSSGTWGNLTWKLDNNGLLTISGSGAMDGFNSDSTTAWRAYKDGITSVRIERGVTSVGSYAFAECSALTSVTLPEGLTSFDKVPFGWCVRLESLTLPTSVTNINDLTFVGCDAVTDIYYGGTQAQWNAVTIGDENGSLLNATVHCSGDSADITGTWGNLTWKLDDNGLLTISGKGAMAELDYSASDAWLAHKDAIVSVVIEPGVTSIEHSAFGGCTALTEITIPAGVTSIGHDAFNGCSSLTNVVLPDSVTELGDCVFQDCSSLANVILPAGITAVRHHSFLHCRSLISVMIPTKVTSIEQSAFSGCKALSSALIPVSVTNIANGAFQNCSSLTDIYYGGTYQQWNAITIGGSNAYLKNATIHCSTGITSTWGALSWNLDNNGLLTISGKGAMAELDYSAGDAWLAYKDAIVSVAIEPGVTSIEHGAFGGCTALTEITIPAGVTSIGHDAFNGCTSLTSVTIPDSVTELGECAFQDCTGLRDVHLPAGITTLARYSFLRCGGLTGVTIPANVTEIQKGAFSGCKALAKVTIPKSVTSIASGAFQNCSSLTEVYYAGIRQQWNAITIGSSNSYLKNATVHCQGESVVYDLILPSSLNAIEDEAFAGCRFAAVKLPEHTSSIGSRAFADCPKLRYIYIPEATTGIAGNAFDGVSNLTIIGQSGSYAEFYAQRYGYAFVTAD